MILRYFLFSVIVSFGVLRASAAVQPPLFRNPTEANREQLKQAVNDSFVSLVHTASIAAPAVTALVFVPGIHKRWNKLSPERQLFYALGCAGAICAYKLSRPAAK